MSGASGASEPLGRHRQVALSEKWEEDIAELSPAAGQRHLAESLAREALWRYCKTLELHVELQQNLIGTLNLIIALLESRPT